MIIILKETRFLNISCLGVTRPITSRLILGLYMENIPANSPIWLPYTQMKTAPLPLMAESTDGSRIRLSDGRELIDGLASWWTACHGYNHPHIIADMRKQLDVMPHVMFGGIVHEPALRLAERLVKWRRAISIMFSFPIPVRSRSRSRSKWRCSIG